MSALPATERGQGAELDARRPIVVLLGGPSAEHDVSVVSGNAIGDALEDAGHPVERVLIDLQGAWWRLPAGIRSGLALTAYDDPVGLDATGPEPTGQAVDRLAAADPPPVVFIALHGPFGEDGTIQAILEAAAWPTPGRRHGLGGGHGQGGLQAPGRGLGLPVADWREVTAIRWAADRGARSWASSRHSRPGPAIRA